MDRADVFRHGDDALLFVRVCDSLWLVLERNDDRSARLYFADGETMQRVPAPPGARVHDLSEGGEAAVPESSSGSFPIDCDSDYAVAIGGVAVARLARGREQTVTVRGRGAPQAEAGGCCCCRCGGGDVPSPPTPLAASSKI